MAKAFLEREEGPERPRDASRPPRARRGSPARSPPGGRPARRARCCGAWHRPGSVVPFPVDPGGVGPEVLQGVVLARLWVEHVDHHVAVVLHHPAARLVALHRMAEVAMLSHGGVYLLGDGVDLPAT